MQRIQDNHNRRLDCVPVILMARLMAGPGVVAWPAHVERITYSLYACDPHRPARRRIVGGQKGVAVKVNNVLFDSLQKCPLWTVDSLGYNFRHAFDISRDEVGPARRSPHYVHYEFISMIGLTTIIGFFLRPDCHDRY
jgi:hypothetical protein